MTTQTYQRGGQQQRNSQPGTSLITEQDQLNEAKAKLDRMKAEIEKIAGGLVTSEELVRFTLNACVKNPKLFECFRTPEGTASLFLSVITSRIIEIPCDGIHGYLVPFFQSAYKEKPAAMICQFMPGYKGYVQLAYANQNVASINCAAVFEKDDFDFEYGTQPYLRHKPFNGKAGELRWAYGIVKMRSGHTEFRVLTREDVLKRKAVSKAKDSGPWIDWEPEMWAKTGLHNLAKVAPLGNRVQRALAIDDRIQTHGNLTTSELKAIARETPPALSHEPEEPSAFSRDTDDRRQLEPAEGQQQPRRHESQQEQPEPATAASFMHRLEQALNAQAVKTIETDAAKALADGLIDQGEHNQLLVMVQETRKRLKEGR